MADENGTSGNDVLVFSGTETNLDETLVNPYDGVTASVNGSYNLNNASYDGGAGTDTLLMTPVSDALFLTDTSGNTQVTSVERIQAGAGDDLVILSSASVAIAGVSIDGGDGNDVLWGNSGDDTINGGAGNDQIDGGPGNDTINGGTGDDIIYGGDGNDNLTGGTGSDILHGGAGDDTLNFNADGVYLPGTELTQSGSPGIGSSGETVNIGGMLFSQAIYDGGDGHDSLLLGDGNVVFRLWDADNAYNAAGTPLRLMNVEEIHGGNGNDVIDLSNPNNAYGDVIVYGGTGHNTIWTSSGNDTIYGGNSGDNIDGGTGNDTIYGGSGNDILRGGPEASVTGVASSVTYDHDFSGDTTFPPLVEAQHLQNMEALGVAQGDLSIHYDSTATITYDPSVAGYNSMLGVYAVESDGTISGVQMAWDGLHETAAGSQFTYNVSAGTTLGFFLVADGYDVNHQATQPINFNQGSLNFVYDYGQSDQRAANIDDSGTHVSLVYNDGQGDPGIVLQGNIYHATERGDDPTINPDDQMHVVSGSPSAGDNGTLTIGFEDLYNTGDADYNDAIFNLNIAPTVVYTPLVQDNDTIFGGAGNDTIYGGAGNDVIDGGPGADILYGGQGSDRFVFSQMDGTVDKVMDFQPGQGGDVLDVSQILQGYDPTTEAIANFVKLTQDGANVDLQVNPSGQQGGSFTTVAVLQGGTGGLDLAHLVADGNIAATAAQAHAATASG
jgi:Ca2+-binding RTX toxin-like protein